MGKFTVGKLRELLVALPPGLNVEICKSKLYVDDGNKVVAIIDFETGVHRTNINLEWQKPTTKNEE